MSGNFIAALSLLRSLAQFTRDRPRVLQSQIANRQSSVVL